MSRLPALSVLIRPGCVPGVGTGVRRLGLSLELHRGTSLGHLPADRSQTSGEMGHMDSQRVGQELEAVELGLHP